PKINNPVDPKINNPVDPKINNPVDPKINNPVDPKINNPVDPKDPVPIALAGATAQMLRESRGNMPNRIFLSPDAQKGVGNVQINDKHAAAYFTVEKWTKRRNLTFMEGPLRCLGFTPDGKHLVITLEAAIYEVQIVDPQTNEKQSFFQGHKAPVQYAAFS